MSAQSHQDKASLTVDQSLRQAITCYQAGQLQDAEFIFRDILTDQPQNSDANHNLGILMVQMHRLTESLPHFEAALNANPKSTHSWSSYIDALIQVDLVEPARAALLMSQSLGLGGGEFESLALKLSDKVNGIHAPSIVASRPPLATQRGKSKKIVKESKKGNGREQDGPTSLEMEAAVELLASGEFSEAEQVTRDLTVLYPSSDFGWKALGIALQQQGLITEAVLPMQRAVELSPDDAESHSNLALVLQVLNRLEEAETHSRRAIKIKPDFSAAHNSLANTLSRQNRFEEAEISCRRALQIAPNNSLAYNDLGVILMGTGKISEAGESYREALKIRPSYSAAHSNLLFCLTHDEKINTELLLDEHCRFAEQFEGPQRASWKQHDNLRNPDRCLQIGFISGDLFNHSVANFIEPVLIHMTDYPQLVLHAYSDPEIEDGVTERLRKYFKHWNTITGLSDAVLADKIRSDGIDILIDLSGHTARNRLLTFARKPAPVQVSWIGYPGTTGLQAMDYYLADPFFLPPGQFDDQFTEKIIHLPATAPFSQSHFAPPVNTLPALSNGYITFGSFNRSNKINPSVIALWSQLLRALPSSRMLLGAMSPDGKNDSLVEMVAREGIASDRLILHPRAGMESYLHLYHQVDICLDTFPYNGGTTSYHALSMGVPTLTLTGSTPPGRQGVAILEQVGLEAFVAKDKADFVEKGLSWADNLVELSILRLELRERLKQSAMGQPAIIASGLERALRIMWRRWCAGQPTESFEVRRHDVGGVVQGGELKVAEPKQQTLPIYVTQPLLPPLEEFIPYLQQIWDSKQLTNGGPFHQQLEQELCEYLGVKHISLFSNGTLALMTAMQSLRITGEVITTPYSFVATAHSLLWNGIKPVFVDIDPVTLNLDPRKIEAAITPQTTAIMPVHCYGHPCDVKSIQKIADNYGLKVIYDAAHAFGVQCPDGSILNHGDLSVLSFHATKVFNTFEGGAIVCHDAKTKQRIDQLKNFGFVDEITVVAAGINGKMSEVNAAFGLLQLKSINQALQSRKLVDVQYRKALAGVKGVHCLSESGEKVANYAYFPILVGSDYPLSRDELYQKLRDNGVYARRYFYPIVSDFPMYRGMPSAAHSNLPVAKGMAEKVICLPIYPDLSDEQIDLIVQLIMNKAGK